MGQTKRPGSPELSKTGALAGKAPRKKKNRRLFDLFDNTERCFMLLLENLRLPFLGTEKIRQTNKVIMNFRANSSHIKKTCHLATG